MSEYQYHEWQTVDRALTPAEQDAVNDLSSHIDVSAGQAVVTYHWINFRHDPKRVLLEYFDGYFYLANWGSLRLMFRFPKGLLDEADIEPYCTDEYISFETAGGYQGLDLDFNPEEGGGWMEAEAGLSLFIQLRADLLEGDFRLLYLAWLKAATLESAFDETGQREPPVPPGLKKLSPPLRHFVQVFEIDPFLVQAAAEASPEAKRRGRSITANWSGSCRPTSAPTFWRAWPRVRRALGWPCASGWAPWGRSRARPQPNRARFANCFGAPGSSKRPSKLAWPRRPARSTPPR